MQSGKIYLSLFFIILITVFLWFSSCSHKANISELPTVCFTSDILPVFRNNCAIDGCHTGSGGGDGHRAINSYINIIRDITPGNPDASRIYQAIIAKWGNRMPPTQPLSLENRVMIRVWIEQGANNTTCGDTTGTGGNNFVSRACFARDIFPVISSKCASTKCHDAVTHREGYNYTTYSRILNSVTPGNPGSSRLYRVITTSGGEDKMPPSGSPQLTVAEIDSIGKWISYGALDENCGEVCDTINPVTFSGVIWPALQTNCTGCHSGSAPSGGVLLASYNNTATVASSGLLMNALNGNGVTKMPPAGSLSACRIRQFDIWVRNGFPNN